MSSLRDLPALPARAVDRLFARFVAAFGAPAMQRMWADAPMDEVKATWGAALGRFSLDQILAGLQALDASGATFPPTLPEFAALCREQIKPASHRPALPVPARTADEIAAGAEQMARIRQMLRGATKRVPA
jgi:hypothetical protein